MGTHTAVNLACGHPFYSAWHSIRRCKWTLPWQCKWTLTWQCKWTLTRQCKWTLTWQCKWTLTRQCKPTLNWWCKWILTWQCKRNLTWQCKQTSTWQCKWTVTWLRKWTLIWQCKWTLTWPCKWTVTWQCKRTLAITPIFPALPILVMAIILVITYMGMCAPRDFLVLMPAVSPCSHCRGYAWSATAQACADRCLHSDWLATALHAPGCRTRPILSAWVICGHASAKHCGCFCCFSFATGNFYVMIYTAWCPWDFLMNLFMNDFTWTSLFAVVI